MALWDTLFRITLDAYSRYSGYPDIAIGAACRRIRR